MTEQAESKALFYPKWLKSLDRTSLPEGYDDVFSQSIPASCSSELETPLPTKLPEAIAEARRRVGNCRAELMFLLGQQAEMKELLMGTLASIKEQRQKNIPECRSVMKLIPHVVLAEQLPLVTQERKQSRARGKTASLVDQTRSYSRRLMEHLDEIAKLDQIDKQSNYKAELSFLTSMQKYFPEVRQWLNHIRTTGLPRRYSNRLKKIAAEDKDIARLSSKLEPLAGDLARPVETQIVMPSSSKKLDMYQKRLSINQKPKSDE